MIQFKNILRFPISLQKRQEDWMKLTPTIVRTEKTDTGIIIVGNCSNYIQVIEFQNENINMNTEIKINCTCHSFKFEFAYILNSVKSLYQPEYFIRSTTQSPNQKNKGNIIAACKHIVALANLVDKNQHRLLI